MHALKFEISLRFFTKIVDPSEIYTELGLRPKWQHTIGEPRKTPKGDLLEGVYDSSYCTFCFNRRKNEQLHEMLDRIVDELLLHKELFDKIRNTGGRSEFFIGIYLIDNNGDTLTHKLLCKIAKLGIDLALDIYGGN